MDAVGPTAELQLPLLVPVSAQSCIVSYMSQCSLIFSAGTSHVFTPRYVCAAVSVLAQRPDLAPRV